jgi:hypothetical protein
MVVNGKFHVAVRCEACSLWEIYPISLFKLKKGKINRFQCACKDSEFYIRTRDYKTFDFMISCAGCGKTHLFHYSLKDLFDEKGNVGKCHHTYVDVLLVGAQSWIKEYVRTVHKEVLEIMKELGFYNYFCNPEIMIKSINYIHMIAKEKKLFCDCGSTSIQMNLYFDRIELKCMRCNSISVIYTETIEDLKNLIRVNPIILHEKAFTCIDAVYYKGNTENQ